MGVLAPAAAASFGREEGQGLIGLVSALIGDGIFNVISWLLLGGLLGVIAWALATRRT